MAEEIGVRLEVRDRARFSREMREARQDVDRFGDTTQSSAIQAHRSTQQITGMSRAAGRIKSSFTSALPASIALAGVLGLGVGGLAYAASQGVEEFTALDKVQQQTRAGIKSTEGVANVTAKGVRGLAMRLEDLSSVDENLIQAGSNVLLTFTKIRDEVGKGNDIFTRANESALDLSVRFGKDLGGQAIMLGKALQDPIKGMNAMSRSGVTFNEKQKDTITRLVESNRLLDAQKLILKEVETQVGGSAKAYGETLAAAVDRGKDSFLDFARSIVDKFEPQIREVLDDISGAFKRFARTLEREGLAEAMKTIFPDWAIDNIDLMAGAIAGALIPAVVALGVAIAGSLTLALGIFVAIGVAAALIIRHWKPISGFFRGLWQDVEEVTGNFLSWIVARFADFMGFFLGVAEKILGAAAFAFGWIPGIGDKIKGFRDDFRVWRKDVVADIDRVGRNLQDMAGVGVGALRALTGAAEDYKAAFSGALAARPGAINPRPPSPPSTPRPRQAGGPALATRPYLVGERGPELFIPSVDGDVLSHEASKRIGGGPLVVNLMLDRKIVGRAVIEDWRERAARH